MGAVAVNNGLQVLGGYGYTEDFILEQLARDIRIMSLVRRDVGHTIASVARASGACSQQEVYRTLEEGG